MHAISVLRIPGVAKVDLLGLQEERVFIEVSSQVLAERGLSALDIESPSLARMQRQPSRPGRDQRAIRAYRCGRRAPIGRGNPRTPAARWKETIRLGDIAKVTRGLEDPPVAKARYQGKEAVSSARPWPQAPLMRPRWALSLRKP